MTSNTENNAGGIGRNQYRNAGRNQVPPALSEAIVRGLLAIHRFRLLTVAQFARVSKLNAEYAREKLRELERKRFLGSIGNVGLRGGSKAPKLYFLNRSGHVAMLEATGLDETMVGKFVRPHTSTLWSPIMAHRVGTIDLLVAAETGLCDAPEYRLVQTLHEYRRVKIGSTWVPETADQVVFDVDGRIVPDGAFVIENTQSGKRGLYFVECDRGTERITTAQEAAYSITDKFETYERYLRGGRFAEKYQRFGSFSFATVLFVTTSPARIDAIRAASARLDKRLHGYFLLTSMEEAMADFFGAHWRSRDPHSPTSKALLKRRPEP